MMLHPSELKRNEQKIIAHEELVGKNVAENDDIVEGEIETS